MGAVAVLWALVDRPAGLVKRELPNRGRGVAGLVSPTAAGGENRFGAQNFFLGGILPV
jgi:hypothetical protein